MSATAEMGDPGEQTIAEKRRAKRVLVVGATGYIGQHAVRELLKCGYQVLCVVRGGAATEGLLGAELREADLTQPASLLACLKDTLFDYVVSCVASRTGAPKDAWLVDYQVNRNVLDAAKVAGATHFVLLSAICVQRPKLAFQHAKVAFERELIASGLTYSIVRPTAFFKSLAGQIERIKRGAAFVFFGDGTLTACKPIGERDLARFIVDCFDDPTKLNAILPIGGPGPAITPKQQADLLFELCGLPPRYRGVPVTVIDVIIQLLTVVGWVSSKAKEKAELARIGRYYGTESMLSYDASTGRYDAACTPSFGEETLRAFYSGALREGLKGHALGSHAVFSRE